MINRGGEKLAAAEIEECLMRHPAILEAAAIGWPDDRLGERIGVFVRLKSGATLSLAQIATHFEEQGMGKHKTPERLMIVTDLPRSVSGKVLKSGLRDLAERQELISRLAI